MADCHLIRYLHSELAVASQAKGVNYLGDTDTGGSNIQRIRI